MRRLPVLLPVMVVLTAGCESSHSDRVVATTAAPCSLSHVHIGVAIQGDSSGTVPDPIGRVERDSKGRYYTAVASGGEIAQWSSDGHFIRSLGQPGRGPGELDGSTAIFVDKGDSVHVRDNAMAWTIFSPTGEFVRRVSAVRMASRRQQVAMLDDGTILSANTRVDPPSSRIFHITDHNGQLQRSFGDVSMDQARAETGRTIAYSGGRDFWAAATDHSPGSYSLEHWTIDGDLLGVIHRDVEWFTNGRAPRRENPPPPSVFQLHINPDGTLIIFASVPNGNWKEPRPPLQMPDESMGDVYHEVIDPVNGRVIASRRMNKSELVPVRMLPGTMNGYTLTESEYGFVRIDIVAPVLQPFPATECDHSVPSTPTTNARCSCETRLSDSITAVGP